MLLNRVTKSAIVRLINVEVGDMPQENVGPHLQRIKMLMEQKSAINVGSSMQEYTNPGPIENNLYIPTYNGKGAITTSQVGGDVNVGQLPDLEYYQNKFFSSTRIPKQYFGLCLRGNTPILLLNGQTVTIKEMFENKDEYISKGIMACNTDGSLCPTTITDVKLTQPHTSFLRIHLDNEKFVDVTPNHRMMLRNGSFIDADKLIVGDSLMPYYDKIHDGRRYILDNKSGKYKPQYRVVAESVCDIPKGYQVHHKNLMKIDDDFTNLEPLTLQEHFNMHIDYLHEKARKASQIRKESGKHTSQQGKIGINNGLENRWIDRDEVIPEDFTYGHIHNITDKTRKQMSEKRLRVLEEHPEYKSLGG